MARFDIFFSRRGDEDGVLDIDLKEVAESIDSELNIKQKSSLFLKFIEDKIESRSLLH